MPEHPGALAAQLPVADADMEFVVTTLMRLGGYHSDPVEARSGVATGNRSSTRDYGFRGAAKLNLLCRWKPHPGDNSQAILGWIVRGGGNQPVNDATASIGGYLGAAVQSFVDRAPGLQALRDPVVGPGASIADHWEGQLLDLSGFATEAELTAAGPENLARGVLPLGRYAWGHPGATTYGRNLYLNHFGSERMEYRGTLVCAPPGAGKTELILNWAVCAIANGYGVLVVDVKGDLRGKITQRLAEVGAEMPNRNFYFSTNPDPAVISDRINFLAGLSGETATGRAEIEQLARAILPIEGFDQGEELRHYQNRLAWLTALIGLVKLHEQYRPHRGGRNHDLGDVYNLASREDLLCGWIGEIAAEEAKRGEKRFEPGLAYWFDELALLVTMQFPVAAADRKALIGQRAERDPYRYLTQGIVTALRAFSEKGVLGRKVSGSPSRKGEGYQFSISDLLGPEQTVIILEARELDVGSAEVLVSIAVTHLQLLLNRRHVQDNPLPVLLLLDETARINGFDAKKYIALGRSAKAGVVLVFQQLDQISRTGSKEQVLQLLQNVGTVIFLGSLAGNTHEYFRIQRGQRWMPSFMQAAGVRSYGRELQISQVQQEEIPRLPRIPAGNFPAIVYIRDHRCNKAILVDMDRKNFKLRREGQEADEDEVSIDKLDLPPILKNKLRSRD
jgi:hypothetical protein